MSRPTLRMDARPRARPWSLRPLARLLRNLGGCARDLVVAAVASRTPREWVVLRLDRGVTETDTPRRWIGSWMPGPSALPLILEALERIEDDSEVRGVLLRVGTAPIGWAKAASLARALERVRGRGKRLVVYSTNGGNAAAWLGALADRFWMAPQARLDLIGVRLESPFVRGILDRFGVRPFVLQAGRYKGVGEILERTAMSEDSREALGQVADDLYGALVGALIRRAGSEAKAHAWVDGGPYLAAQALEAGIIDALVYPDELRRRVDALTATAVPPDSASTPKSEPLTDVDLDDGETRSTMLPPETYLRLARPRFRWPAIWRSHPQIVVVPILGGIDNEQGRRVGGWLTDLRSSEDVAAVVLRIDSPGGDPAASDLIWHAVGRLRERKPVVASMGDTAASGGYYAAMAANVILAEPTTLTGSIGVVMAGVEVEAALAELGVRFDGVQRGEHAGIWSLARERSDEERALLRRQVDLLYEEFVAKAAAGRRMEPAQLEALAQGRVWSGAAALACGLVDELGGVGDAVARARVLAGLEAEEGEVAWVHPPSGPWRRFLPPPDDRFDTANREATASWNPSSPRLWCPIRPRLH